MSRKSFNLSLQKKRNQVVLTPIIERCDVDGSYVADKVVDYVEKALNYERSVGLNKVQNTYGLIKNTLASEYAQGSPEFDQRVEDVLRSIIQVDGERLAHFLSDPGNYSSEATKQAPRKAAPPPAAVAVEAVAETPTPVVATNHEAVMTQEEIEYEREQAERAQKKEQRRRQQELARQAEANSAQEAEDEDEDEDDELIRINEDAINNF